MPRAILIDLYNSLVDGGDSQRWPILQSMGIDLGVDPDRFANLYTETYPQRLIGALGDLETTIRSIAAAAGGSPGPSAVRLAATRRRTFIRDLLWPAPATLAALDQLRAGGWLLGLVSNCTVETPQLWRRTPLANRFQAAGFSCELGVAKPDPAIYLAVCSFLGVAPADCVYVGDGGDSELPTASSLGMTVIRTVEFISADSSWPRQRISSMTELPRLLNGPLTGPPARSPMTGAPG